jgi:hypothetical protein
LKVLPVAVLAAAVLASGRVPSCPAGSKAYLMMDVRSWHLWCNTALQTRLPGFETGELRAVKWLGWVP